MPRRRLPVEKLMKVAFVIISVAAKIDRLEILDLKCRLSAIGEIHFSDTRELAAIKIRVAIERRGEMSLDEGRILVSCCRYRKVLHG